MRRKRNLIKFITVTSVFASFPLIFCTIKWIPKITSAVEKYSDIYVGNSAREYVYEKTENNTSNNNLATLENPVSEGFGSFIDDYELDELITETISDSGDKPYPTQWNADSIGTIIQSTYCRFSGTKYFDLEKAAQVRNETSLSNETLYEESLKLPDFKIEISSEPQVLIMHTHTTETYEPTEREKYDTSFNYRTTDSTYNMVMVGNAIAEELEKEGIGVIHSSEIHDYPSYNGSYERSARTVKEILEKYPSIKVVLDIHRDAITDDDNLIAPIISIDDEEAAQVMIISGCDDGTMNMPNYLKNFRFACLLQTQMELDHEGFTRPILFDYRKYNQDLTTGSLLIEVGSHGNTLKQAETAGYWIGESLAKCLKKLA
jgi:stage II sporulation protein P